jgi:elongation factor G
MAQATGISTRVKIDKIRNIGIIAHIDAGKTTTTERILFYSGRIHDLGDVDEGDTEMDWMPQERERGITITSAATNVEWQGCQINIIDTPGHVDFTAEVERSLRVLDGAITIFSGVEMVESQTEKVWRQADRYGIPRLAYVNKLDRIGSRFGPTLDMMKERLGTIPLPVQAPVGSGDEFQGMIDLLQMKFIRWDQATQGVKYELLDIPAGHEEQARAYRMRLLETLSELDDGIMESYLHDEPITIEQLKEAIRKACITRGAVPVLGGSSLQNIGVQPLLDAVVDYLPSPLDRGEISGLVPDGASVNGQRLARRPSLEEPLAGLAFKVATDEYTGRLVYVRIYSGQLEKGSYVLNPATGKQERISRIFLMHANRRTELESTSAGSIAAVVGPKELSTGDTICDTKHPILLEKIDFPEPVVSAAIEPKSDAEEDRLNDALHKLVQEDPTVRVNVNPDTNQTIVAGMGELHLEILFDRLKREFKVDANVGRPQVAYKTTLAELADIEEKFVKQTGGRGQYAHVCIKFEPLEHGKGFEFVDETKGGVIPKEYIPAVRKGLQEALGSGPLGGFPIVDIRARLYYGSFHAVDSSEIAFKTAAAHALHAAFHKVRTKLLEPIMEGEIVTPTDYVGELVGDIHGRRGEVKGFDVVGNTQVIKITIPLAETFGYTTILRSITQGRATYSLRFSRYAEVPAQIREAVLKGR